MEAPKGMNGNSRAWKMENSMVRALAAGTQVEGHARVCTCVLEMGMLARRALDTVIKPSQSRSVSETNLRMFTTADQHKVNMKELAYSTQIN